MSSEPEAAVPAKRVTWRGRVYDSQLEADWHCTLESWGLEVTHHPGSLPLADGSRYEPDFLIVGWDGVEVLGEAKGPSDDRLWKAAEVDRMHPELGGVVVLRPGIVVPGSENESAGAVWHGTRKAGPEWYVGFRTDKGGAARLTRDPEPSANEEIRLSAERCWVRPDAYGLGMRKAVG